MIDEGYMDSDTSQVYVSMVYDRAFGLYDHWNELAENPLSTIAYHDAERYVEESGLYRYIRLFSKRNLKDRYFNSINEFLSLPMYVIEMLDHVDLELVKDKEAEDAENEKRIEREGGVHGNHRGKR